jgi:hypothetical protein
MGAVILELSWHIRLLLLLPGCLTTAAVVPPQQKQPAGSVPAAKAATAAAAAGSSSDEESDDDVFLLRHRPLELEERQRFLSYTTGAPQPDPFHQFKCGARWSRLHGTVVPVGCRWVLLPAVPCGCLSWQGKHDANWMVLHLLRWQHEGACKGRARPQAEAERRQPPRCR